MFREQTKSTTPVALQCTPEIFTVNHYIIVFVDYATRVHVLDCIHIVYGYVMRVYTETDRQVANEKRLFV